MEKPHNTTGVTISISNQNCTQYSNLHMETYIIKHKGMPELCSAVNYLLFFKIFSTYYLWFTEPILYLSQ